MAKRTIIKPYKSYMFKDKDPVIDVTHTIVQDSGKSYAEISEDSGVAVSTMGNWFTGPTRRPQFATVQAVVRALGYNFTPVKNGKLK